MQKMGKMGEKQSKNNGFRNYSVPRKGYFLGMIFKNQNWGRGYPHYFG